MKKYKVLLTGRNSAGIDDFFNHLFEDYEMMTTSTRLEDFQTHAELFKPDIFVICLNGESRDDINRIKEFKRTLTKMGIITVVVASEEDSELFSKIALYMEDLTLLKPISSSQIRERINNYMHEIEREREEQRLMEEKLAAIKEAESRKHVLVIDDDPMMLKLIKEHLHEKYDVATAISGKIAYKFLENKKTNLILLDYEMPFENGPTVLQKLRENEELADIPVIFLTGITDKDKIKEALALMPQGYLLKPIDVDKLFGIIERFIG